jgi:uncharacterized protein YdeI (YjbR/CyaY-like superfamily)
MIGTPGGTPERPAVFFADAAEFRAWLEAHHDTATELWMGLRKRHVPDRGLTWEEAVPEALCFGWIDSVSQRIDDDSRRQRWTPRRPGSGWSDINLAHVERLVAEGRMHPAGLEAYARRPPARSGPRSLSAAQLERITAEPAAAAFWQAATPAYRKNAADWVTEARQETTRERRLQRLVDACARGERVPPLEYGVRPKWLDRAAAAATAAARSTGAAGAAQVTGESPDPGARA